jgi:hypothetical protein
MQKKNDIKNVYCMAFFAVHSQFYSLIKVIVQSGLQDSGNPCPGNKSDYWISLRYNNLVIFVLTLLLHYSK